ncbi:TonB family protein, partial [Gammaproteobacteria bacterium]|nr:TonB family protein [Gammaproteobacteria bacterium]
ILAKKHSKHRPKRADFLAQLNQAGSRAMEDKALISTTSEDQFQHTETRKADQKLRQRSSHKMNEDKRTAITATNITTQKITADSEETEIAPQKTKFENKKSLQARALEIASLEARIIQQRQTYAENLRIKRLTSLSTVSRADEFYLNSWRRKIESVGNLNYPQKARKNKLYGSLRLMVAILADGSLREVKLLDSSGHKVLDDAAIRIARLSAPYAPFPDELRKSTDVLEIIRTWQFKKNSSLRSY